ncbi:MAG: tetratricopeptide repeat protein [Bacteroidia bacterium]
MKRILFFLLLLFVSAYSFSQPQAKIDSLTEVLATTGQDSNRVKILDNLADEYYGRDWDKVKVYSQEALLLSRKIGFTPGEINASTSRGICYAISGRIDSAIQLQKNAVRLAKRTHKLDKMSAAINNLAIIFTQQSQMDSALHYNGQAIALSREVKDTLSLAKALYSYSNIAYSKRDFNTALEGYLEALALKRAIGANFSKQLSALGMCYQEMGQWREARGTFEESIVVAKAQNEPTDEAWALKNLGVLSRSLSEPHENALAYFEEAVSLMEQANEDDNMAEILLDLGRVQIDLKRYKAAESSFQRSYDIYTSIQHGMGSVQAGGELARTKLLLGKQQEADLLLQKAFEDKEVLSGMPETVSLVYEELVETYSEIGDYKNAFLFSEKTRRLKDSLLQQSRDRDFAQMAEEYEADKREATITLLEENTQLKDERIANQNTSMMGLGLGILVLGGLAFLLFQNSQKRKAANLLLAQKNTEIEKQHAQKAILLKEIHHRVKNNLQVISSLLNLQSREVEDVAAKEALNEGQNRVRSMALIHQRLYQKDELGLIDMQEYIEELVGNLQQSFVKAEKDITITTSLASVEADVDKAIPIGLILNELITNAFKYAFEGKMRGNIALNMSLDAQQNFSLSVQDDGVGISDSDQKKGKSFGMKLVRSLSKGLNAKLEVQGQHGTQVSILIPNFSAQVAL